MSAVMVTDACISIREWAQREPVELVWETGSGDNRLRGWRGISSGLRAIETNADPVWSEDATLDLPFDAFWDARSLSPAALLGGGK